MRRASTAARTSANPPPKFGEYSRWRKSPRRPCRRRPGETSLRTVVAASSLGATFEWYDFFVFGSLTQVISRTFFSGLNETAGYIAALALFGAGFAFRPIGALAFGRIGDRVGRKGAFLVTVALMGGRDRRHRPFAQLRHRRHRGPDPAPPDAHPAGLRARRGVRRGGDLCGRAPRPPGARGRSTSWVQTAAAFGLFAALLVILLTRLVLGKTFGPTAFDAWGWRIPFLVSAGLLAVSVFMRMKLTESPAFTEMKAEGTQSTAPYAEAFGQWKNLKLVILALVAVMFAQGAVWYTAFFYTQTFMEKFLKVDPTTINGLMMAAVAASAPLYVLFGWLSDKVGPQTGHAVRHDPDAGGLFPRLPPAGRNAQPGAGRGPGALARHRHRRPGRLLAAVRSGGQGLLHLVLRHRQERARQRRGLLHQRGLRARAPPAMVRVGMATIPSLDARGLPKDVAKGDQDQRRDQDQGGPGAGRLSGQGRPQAHQPAGRLRRDAALRRLRDRPLRAHRPPSWWSCSPPGIRYTALSLP